MALVLVTGACSNGGSKNGAAKNAAAVSGAPELSLAAGVADGLKVGLIVSSAGPGVDLKDLAAGAYVAAFRLNDAKAGSGKVELIVADDNGTPEGATAAMKDLAAKNVLGVVYASTGDHVLAGAATAAELGLPVVLPYADDPKVAAQGATSFLAAPSIEQSAKELASQVKKSGFSKTALLRQGGAYGDAGRAALTGAGLTFALDEAFNAGDAVADLAKKVVAGGPDAVVVWAEAAPALAMVDALSIAGSHAAVLLGNRAPVPAFGHGIAASLAPALGDGTLSVGEWAGADTPTAAVDAFYLARDRAVSDGGVSADLGLADLRSHDAVLALVSAATSAKSSTASQVLDALRTVKTSSVKGVAGVPMDFSSQHAVADDDVALLSYSTIDDGRGRHPAPATGGGHWVPVAGSYSLPEALKGLDDPYGG
jgi:ABC-type branched-subunit amino acid transport system substrate-binding protein